MLSKMEVKNRKLVNDHNSTEFALSYTGAVLHNMKNFQIGLELCGQTNSVFLLSYFQIFYISL